MTLDSKNDYFAGIRNGLQNLADQWALDTYQKIRDAWLDDVRIDGVIVELEGGGLQIITAYHHGGKDLSDLEDPVTIARYVFHRVR